MQRTTHNRAETRWRTYQWIALVLFGLLLVTAIVAGLVYWLKTQSTRTNFTTDKTQLQIVVGNDVLRVPANLMRFPAQRKETTLKQLDIALLWPSGLGYTEETASQFQNTGKNAKLIFLTIASRKMKHDMNGRLRPIYSKLFEGESRKGPAGLLVQELAPGKGYDGEVLVVSAQATKPWVARCQKEAQFSTPTCLRDIFIGEGLSVTYRFPLTLIREWSKIETMVLHRTHGMLVR